MPWNKGKRQPKEVRARISAGVRANIRKRFLAKLQGLGLTEAEYEEQEQYRRMEKASRKTEKGGYRLTEETKQKISKRMRELYATGQRERTRTNPSKVRKGFRHSSDTKAKISRSLQQRWAHDPEYQARMRRVHALGNSVDVRKKISETLRKKWKQPEFRMMMMKKILDYRKGKGNRSRESMSNATKWLKAKYMNMTQPSSAKQEKRRATSRQKHDVFIRTHESQRLRQAAISSRKNTSHTASLQDGFSPSLCSVATNSPMKRRRDKNSPATPTELESTYETKQGREGQKKGSSTQLKTKSPKKVTRPAQTGFAIASSPCNLEIGNLSLLRDERRDLYELLYGDEDDDLSPCPAFSHEEAHSFEPCVLEDG